MHIVHCLQLTAKMKDLFLHSVFESEEQAMGNKTLTAE